MKPRDPRIVELLNEALTYELTITNTYFLNARMLDNWGFPRLGKVFYDLSIDEMKDADSLIQRILMFDGHPNVQRLNGITIGEDAEEVLSLAYAGEVEAVRMFNAAADECRALIGIDGFFTRRRRCLTRRCSPPTRHTRVQLLLQRCGEFLACRRAGDSGGLIRIAGIGAHQQLVGVAHTTG